MYLSLQKKNLLLPLPQITTKPTRTLTKYSWSKGKRKSVKVVLEKFYRLNWGIWIRTKCGRNKKIWKKSSQRRRRLRQHVFCNASQSWMLDKMVGPYWQKPKYYVEDPYEPYHTREEFAVTAMKPRPYFPPEENSSHEYDTRLVAHKDPDLQDYGAPKTSEPPQLRALSYA
ncbi:unnamed protein product, partial [Callosobruchus maculatus]